VTAVVSYNLGRRPGTYVVTLHANGLSDRAGNKLIETRFVKYPQTTNSPDPDYIAQISVNKRGGATNPVPYISAAERAAASRFSRLRGTVVRRLRRG
jgi:hypothetical protein